MDVFEKLCEIGHFMHYEPAEELRSTRPEVDLPVKPGYDVHPRAEARAAYPDCPARPKEDYPIFSAAMPGGKRITLLKTLLTTACERDCNYCCFRSGMDTRRTSFKPEELARAFMGMYRSGAVRGLFLSSGVAGGGVRTQDRLIAAAEILRQKLGYRGYLHLKIMPGADRDQVERTMQLADRVSVNLEAPNTVRLEQLAPHKVFMEELLQPLEWVEEIRRSQPPDRGWNNRWPSTTTQFVVGAVGESDLELLSATAFLNRKVRLARAYYSGFSPVRGTPLEDHPAVNPWRQHRLYQASFLLRDYGFDLEDMPFSSGENLPLGVDPKMAWAQDHLAEAPVELNRADRHDLLRVPGVGPKGVQAILSARRVAPLRDLQSLRAIHIQADRAAPFILLAGKRPEVQLKLF